MRRKVLSMILAACMVLALIPSMAMAEGGLQGQGLEPVEYIGPDGNGGLKAEPDVCYDYTVIDENTTDWDWETGWYVVKGDITLEDQTVKIDGDVKLVLTDGSNFSIGVTKTKDIYQAIGKNSGQLSIYGQSDGTGTLSIQGGTACNFIRGIEISDLNIYGGVVTINGCFHYGVFVNNLNVYGGKLYSDSRQGGICVKNSLNICNDAEVTAKSETKVDGGNTSYPYALATTAGTITISGNAEVNVESGTADDVGEVGVFIGDGEMVIAGGTTSVKTNGEEGAFSKAPTITGVAEVSYGESEGNLTKENGTDQDIGTAYPDKYVKIHVHNGEKILCVNTAVCSK